ncbi:MAG TPA: PQQ-binding-like beta-propeller repeat protein [Jatrophihabitans sp.]|nr:PQQ-binding-like beta-propeller repeat protein [Jatrophihabitans sp.]
MAAFLVVLCSVLLAAPAGAATPPDQWTSEYAGGANTSANLGEQLITAATASQLTQAWQTANGADFVAPAIVNGVVYHVINAGNASIPGQFVAVSARTGAQLWSTALPPYAWYYRGQTIAGNIALLPFEGIHELGGITAVDLTSHAVLWSRSRPPSTTNPSNDDGTGGPIAVDSGRVFLNAGNNAISAYDINTGALLWQLDPPDGVRGIAAAGGRLYTGGFPSYPGPGLAVYDGATGKQLWTSPYLYGIPVVVGSYVVVPTAQGVAAVAAAGCGKSVCPRIWSAGITDANPQAILIGGATSSTLFVTATLTDNTARLIRLNTSTGARQWTVNLAQPSGEVPIRAGDTVWVMANANAVIGWSATATTSTHLRKISLPSNSYGAVGGLAAAGGSLVVDVWPYTLTAYRVPGT